VALSAIIWRRELAFLQSTLQRNIPAVFACRPHSGPRALSFVPQDHIVQVRPFQDCFRSMSAWCRMFAMGRSALAGRALIKVRLAQFSLPRNFVLVKDLSVRFVAVEIRPPQGCRCPGSCRSESAHTGSASSRYAPLKSTWRQVRRCGRSALVRSAPVQVSAPPRNRAIQDRSRAKSDLAQVGPAQVRLGQVRLAQVSPLQLRPKSGSHCSVFAPFLVAVFH